MKKMIRTLLILVSFLCVHDRLLAFTYYPDLHMQVIYDLCGRDIIVTFVYHQSEGDDDRMLHLKLFHRPSSGADQAIIDFRHLNHWPNDETGLDTLPVLNGIGARYADKFPAANWNFNIVRTDHWFDPAPDDQGAIKYYVQYHLYDLPQNIVENFYFYGTWDGEGSNSPNLDFDSGNTFRSIQIQNVDAPSALTATQGQCGLVRLNWENNETESCMIPGYSYYFRILKDNLFLTDLLVPNISQVDFEYTDLNAPNGSGLPENQYDYKVQLIVKKNATGVVTQTSTFAGPVTGNPLPLPSPPTNLTVEYPNCTGGIKLNWQNPQIYTDIFITLTPSVGTVFRDTITGTLTTYTGTITDGITWTATVEGVDLCDQTSAAQTPGNLMVPHSPGEFTLGVPIIGNGSYILNWTQSAGAVSYTITRTSPNGTDLINIDNGATLTYTDPDVQTCTAYSYRVKANNSCGSTNTSIVQAPIIPSNLQVWSDQKLTGSKGYYGNRVELTWDAPDLLTFDHFKIYRKPLGSPEPPVYLASVIKNELIFVDVYAQAGVLYEYSLKAFSDCNGSAEETAPLVDIGFRLPIATVSGNVKFETGTGVPDVEITVERNAGNLGKGLHFDGQGMLTMHPVYAENPVDRLPLLENMTVEVWMRSENLSADFSVFQHVNGDNSYGLYFDASAEAFVQYWSNATDAMAKSYPVDLSTVSFSHVAWMRQSNDISLAIDGTLLTGSAISYTSPGGIIPLTFGAQLTGYLDEMRFWNTARTIDEINTDYQQILRGDEEYLIGYWRIGEGVGNGVYDISGVLDVFNGNHLKMNAHVTWENIYPTASQLGNLSRTDSVGNYTIKNIAYTGVGNTFTVIPFYSPGGTPHEFDPASTVLFMGEGNGVQNGINFVDISAFKVTGTIVYSLPDSVCPSTKAFIYIDDKVATINGQPVFADASGNFEISVPIGLHRISVAQAGHVFGNNGQFPPYGGLFDFQQEISGVELFDSTRVRVIGRVVGGTREGDKRLGFGDSKNNIGKAVITFTPQAAICASFTVETDSLHGEYAVDLLPLKYTVEISIPSNPLLSFGSLDILDLTVIRPTAYILDSVLNFAGHLIRVDSVAYNVKQNFIYRSVPEVDIVQASDGQPLKGDSVYILVDPDTRDTTFIPLEDMLFPVFFAGKKYPTIISAFEPYVNADNPMDIVEDRVPVSDASITIRNRLGNASGTGQSFDEKFEIMNPDGLLPYTFYGGQPEFAEDPNPPYNHDFTQLFELLLETPNHTVVWLPNGDYFRGYVLGSRPLSGTNFITEGPELVDYVLRDPPGDGSKASFVEGETYTNTQSWFTTSTLSFGTATKLKAGMAYFFGGGMVGIGFDTEVENDNNLKFEMKSALNADGEYTQSTTFEQEISTNTDPFFVGDQSDIYMGKSMNYLFGASEELLLVNTDLCNVIDACVGPEIMVEGESYRLGKRKGIFVVPQGFKTTFVYSQVQITDYLIPNLEKIRNNLFVLESDKYVLNSGLTPEDEGFGLNNDDPFWGDDVTSDDPFSTVPADFNGESYTYHYELDDLPKDLVRWYNQQIRLWQNAIARNEEEKFKAELERNISFDANSSLTYTSSSSQSDKHGEKFEVSLGTSADLFVGGTFGGSGFEFGFNLGLEVVTGVAATQASESVNTYSYTLDDSQSGDFFSVDIKDGKRGNGPVFSLRGGQSMCPWEQAYTTEYFMPGTVLGISTMPRELPQLEVEPSFAANVPSHQPARFLVKMTNASPTGDIQWYRLKLLEDTNPYGGKLSIDFDGTPVDQVFEIPAGQTVEKTLHLLKDEVDFYEMKVVLYSTCEYEAFQNGAAIYAIDTITISAQFVPACSEVNIHTPVDLWVHTVEDNNSIDISVTDYSIDDAGLENLQLQYKPSYTSTWKGMETFWKTVPMGSDDPQIPPGSSIFNYLWNIEELPDGPYDIRVVSHCSNTDNDYPSPHVSGIVDRIRPHAFGNPQPADGVLDPNDEIRIRFNEEINPASIISSNFDIHAVMNGSALRHETSVELDGINDFVEVPAGTRIEDQTFSLELWLKRSTNGAQLIWSQGEEQDSSMAIGFNASNQLYFRWHTSTVTSSAVITNDGLWHHIAITCNQNRQVSFYHTGETAGIGIVNALVSIPGKMVFGKAAWAESGFFKGNYHEARIWRTELTLGAIRSQMLKRFSGAEPGLSMLWPMDEGMGDVLHDIVRKKNASLHGTWSVLPSGSAYAFSVNDELQVDAGTMAFSNQHSFTMEFWMKAAKTGSMQTILSNGKGDGTDGNDSGWAVTADEDGKILISHGGQLFNAIEKDVLDNNWHHVAIVLNRQGNLNTYLDGLLQSSVYGDAFGDFGGAYLWIASRGWYEGVTEMHDQYFNGALDEIRVWNSKLTAENIRANMLNRLMGDEFGLMLYLPFETYSEIGGVPTLTQSLFDQSPYMRGIIPGGNPVFQAEDPNIKLVAPFEKVNFTYAINGDEIVITPTTDPLRIERTVLYISIRNVEDIYGNEMAGPINWTAFVNKNQLQWSEDELYFEKPEKEVFEFTSEIVNSGGIELSYEILGLPEWLSASPSVGTINPVSSKTIHFEISPNILIGDYSTDINLLSGTGLNDKLALDLHVFGVPPAWNIDPAQYAHSMTIVADLDILGELSDDPLDRVVAYINGEVRGLATMQYLPELDRYLGFLDVYSNVTSGEQVTFKVWDASTGATYAGVNLKVGNQTNLQIPFNANTLVGNAVAPARWIVTNDIVQEIPMNAGWTWISFNVLSTQFGNLDNFFAELSFENNDLVQNLTGNQMKSATYNPPTGWQGNLVSQGLEIRKMYQCDFTYQDILRVVGPRVNPDLYPISISTGINWVPMLSSESIEINEALSSFAAVGGDWVKSQNQLAVYHPTQGWVGTLQYMEPGKGYILYSSHNGSIIFPFAANPQNTGVIVENVHQKAINWRNSGNVHPIRPQERNMTIIARLDGANSFSQPPLIAAFASGYLLQTNEAIPLRDGEDGYYYFTLQGHENLEPVYFEIYDASGNYLGLADEKIEWSADQAIGDHEAPFMLHLNKEGDTEMNVHPNPFKDQLYISLETAEAGRGELFIYDAQGKVVHRGSYHFYKPGLQFMQWDGDGFEGSEVPKGAYFVELILGGQVYRETVIRQ